MALDLGQGSTRGPEPEAAEKKRRQRMKPVGGVSFHMSSYHHPPLPPLLLLPWHLEEQKSLPWWSSPCHPQWRSPWQSQWVPEVPPPRLLPRPPPPPLQPSFPSVVFSSLSCFPKQKEKQWTHLTRTTDTKQNQTPDAIIKNVYDSRTLEEKINTFLLNFKDDQDQFH